MDYLRLMYLLGFCSCFCWTKDEPVQFKTTRTSYKIGDTVALTCYVRSDWVTVSFGRNNSELGYCSTINNGCFFTADIRDRYSNYELKLEMSHPMLVIKNVTIDENEAYFTCYWTSYTATTSFAVTDEYVQFEATQTIYYVGDTVTLTCNVRSSWLTVSFERNNSELGYCSTILNGCLFTDDKRDMYGNIELKLEKSRPMLVIKNVTIDENGAVFICRWTSYTDTTSFAVTDKHVRFEATRTTYNVGDTVTLTCYVRSGWLKVYFGRKKIDLGYCSLIKNGCFSTADIRDRYSNYELKLEKTHSMLVIKNVTIDENEAYFTCQWTPYTDTISFAVTGEPVQFYTTKPMYTFGDTVTLKCYVRSSWLKVSVRRNGYDLGICYTNSNRCVPTDDMQDDHWNYELKLEKSHPMLVIRNVTRDDDGADFTCQWNAITATTSFAVTDIAVTTPSTPEEKMSDSSMVLVVVSVLVIVLVTVGILIARKRVLRRTRGCIDILREIRHERGKAPIKTDIELQGTCDTGKERQTTSHTFSEDKGEYMSSLMPNCDVNCDHQKQRNHQMEDRHGPSVHGRTPFLEKNRIDNQVLHKLGD